MDEIKPENSFKLIKMSKGYHWEIKMVSNDIEIIKQKIKDLDDWARMEYGNE